LDALNMLLSSREGECTATVDLCEIDLRSGACRFHKCGAAASYVRRGDSLFHIPAGRLPLGVLEEVDVEKTTVHLQAGDRVILLSDGVSQTPEDAPWLCELLSDRWEDDPEIMADRILNTARAHAEQSDDRTVVIVEIKGKRE
jgi:stage II sporulation protein E